MCLKGLPLAGREILFRLADGGFIFFSSMNCINELFCIRYCARRCPPTLMALSVPLLIALSTDLLVFRRRISATSRTVKKYESG